MNDDSVHYSFLLLRTGVRRSEAAMLSLADLTMSQGHYIAVIQHGKGETRRTVKVPFDVWREIAAYTEALRALHTQNLQSELQMLGEEQTPSSNGLLQPQLCKKRAGEAAS